MLIRAAIAAVWLGGCASGGQGAAAPAAPVVEPFVEELAVGSFHTCARLRGGAVRCWGLGGSGQLGDGSGVQQDRPVTVRGIDDAVQIVAEGSRSCAVRSDGSVWCWGHGASAELDDGAPAGRDTPVEIPGWQEVRQLALALDHDCAVARGGQVLCRGASTRGALGDGGAVPRGPTPAPVVRLPAAEEVAVGYAYSCARTVSGEVWCWGWNEHGQCGEGSQRDHLTPVRVPGIAGARQLVAGFDHACALLADGTASCWGGDTFGQRGDGDAAAGGQPTSVVGLGAASTLWAGHFQTTAIGVDGAVLGWGRDWHLQQQQLWRDCAAPRAHFSEGLRGGIHVSGRREPYCPRPATLPAIPGAVQVVVAQLHACARTDAGRALCWGSNANGAVGDGSGVAQPSPVAVAW